MTTYAIETRPPIKIPFIVTRPRVVEPGLQANLALLPAVTAWAELLLPLWLLIKGINIEQWKKLALASA